MEFAGVRDARIRIAGAADGTTELRAAPDSVTTYQVFVAAAPEAIQGERAEVTFSIVEIGSGAAAARATWFYARKP